MIPLRKEIKDYSNSCEHLISAALSFDAIPFSEEEIDWIAYYAAEMANLVNQLAHKPKTQVVHDRLSLQEFAIASEALFLTDSFSDCEKDSIRQSIADVTTKILDGQEHPVLESQ